LTTSPAFEASGKRKRGFPSETKVGHGHRVVHGNKELVEKLGRNDLCPCGSGRRFQEVLPEERPVLMAPGGTITFRE
jgi:SEC-C motif